MTCTLAPSSRQQAKTGGEGRRRWDERRGRGTNSSSSTEELYIHGKGLFLWKRFISMKEACFYGGGVLPRTRRRHFSTEKADFHCRGVFLQRRHISTAEVYFKEESVSL